MLVVTTTSDKKEKRTLTDYTSNQRESYYDKTDELKLIEKKFKIR
jgi:hypothetical protein